MIQLIISGEVSEEYVFFTDLYQRYQRLMYSVAKRYAASENEAEDIMQDAVERLLKRDSKAHGASWLHSANLSCLYC